MEITYRNISWAQVLLQRGRNRARRYKATLRKGATLEQLLACVDRGVPAIVCVDIDLVLSLSDYVSVLLFIRRFVWGGCMREHI